MEHRQGRISPLLLTCLFIFLPLALAVGVGCFGHFKRLDGGSFFANLAWLQDQEAGKEPQHVWQKATEAYQAGEFARAQSLISPHWQSLVPLAEGCELLVSVLAETSDWPLLEEAAKSCLQAQKGLDTAAEGLAFSLSSQGKIDEAIRLLKEAFEQVEGAKSPRIAVTLARLYLMIAQDEVAKKYFLRGVEMADVWSMWVSYGLKVKPFVEDPAFITQLLTIVAKKPQTAPQVEAKLLEKAKQMNLNQPKLLAALASRLEGALR